MRKPLSKIDVKRTMKDLFAAPKGTFATVNVPELRFVMVDGKGDPNTEPGYKTAIEWVYSVSYAMKFAAKRELQTDYVVPLLEGLWWADDPADFVARKKDRWRWTMMIMVPECVTEHNYEAAVEKARAKLGGPPKSLRLESMAEGTSLQTLHIGSYDDEGPILAHRLKSSRPSSGSP